MCRQTGSVFFKADRDSNLRMYDLQRRNFGHAPAFVNCEQMQTRETQKQTGEVK